MNAGKQAPAFDVAPIQGGTSSLNGKKAFAVGPIVASAVAKAAGDGLKAGLAAVGVATTVVDAETANDDNTAIQQAIGAHADLIVIMGIKTDLVDSSLKAAADAHIPVLSLLEAPVSDNAKAAVKGALLLDTTRAAQLMGAYVLANTGCKTTSGVMYSNLFSVTEDVLGVTKTQFQQMCPDTCKVVGQTYDPTKANTTVGPLAVNMVQRNPEMNAMIFPADDPMATVSVPALKAAGKTVLGVGFEGAPTALKLITDGTMYKADVTNSSPDLMGWTLADSAVRVMLGQQLAPTDKLLNRLITTDNVPADGNAFPEVGDYKTKFKTAWQAQS